MDYGEAKSILDSITKVIKGAATLDLQEKIVDLREYIVSVRDENITLKEENREIKAKLAVRENFVLKNGVYWKEGDDVPFCQRCLEGSDKQIHLQRWSSSQFRCLECEKHYDMRGHSGGINNQFRPHSTNPGR